MDVNCMKNFKNLCKSTENKILEDAAFIIPDNNDKDVTANLLMMLSRLPLERRLLYDNNDDGFELLDWNPGDVMIHNYLHTIFQELAEIRTSILELIPFLRDSQIRIKRRVFHYARNHSFYGRTLQRSTYKKNSMDETDFKKKPLWNRLLQRVMSLIAPFYYSDNGWSCKKQEEKKIMDELIGFYIVNGVNFKSYLNRALIRCHQLDKMISEFKQQLKHPWRSVDKISGVQGLSYQLALSPSQMQRWRTDIEYTLREVKRVKRLFDSVPAHHCWHAIFNILSKQRCFNCI